MILLRRILFYIFLLIYLICCPAVVFYALGISFKPKTQTILKTGLIHLTTLPPGARVYINERSWPQKTPATVRNLSSKEYYVRLVKKNYRSWTRLLPVWEEKATALENIILIPKVWQPQTLSAEVFDNILPLESQPFLLLKEEASSTGLSILPFNELNAAKAKSETQQPTQATLTFRSLRLPEDIAQNSKIKRCFSVAQSRFLLLEVETSKKYQYFWIDLRSEGPIVKEVTDLFPDPPDNVVWDPQEDHILFSLSEQTIQQIDINTMAIYPKIVENVHSFTVSDHRLYVLTQNYILQRFDYNAKNAETLPDNRQLGKELFGKNEKWQITVLNSNTMIFINERGTVLTDYLPYRLVDKGAKGFLFDENTQRLLIWTDQQIGVVAFPKEKPDHAFEDNPRLTWLTKKGNKIEQAFWVNKGLYVLFNDNHNIFLIEAFEKFRSIKVIPIADIRTQGAIAYNEKNGSLLYLDSQTKQLSSLEIVPSEKIETVPKETEAKGKDAI